MIRSSFILFTLLVLLLPSCKKKTEPKVQAPPPPPVPENYDTIKPLPYLPVYPGSYWTYQSVNYSNTTTTTVTYSTSPTYTKSTYNIFEYNSGVAYTTHSSKPSYVPVYSGVAVWGYDESNSSPAPGSPNSLIPLLSESAGASWYTGSAGDDNFYSASVRKINDTVDILGTKYYPTIVVDNFSVLSNTPHLTATYYYTKDIGLVKWQSYAVTIDTTQHILVNEAHLVSYHINK